MSSADALESLLDPASIAVLGSLSSPSAPGAMTVAHLRDAGYSGRLDAASRLEELPPDQIYDVVGLGVPAAYVPQTLDALEGRARNVVVFASGFAEAGGSSLRREGSPRSFRLLGPNSVGYYRAGSRLVMSFAKVFDTMVDCPSGSGAWLLSHSGAFGARLVSAARKRGLYLDGFFGTGNEDDLTAAELMRSLVADDRYRPKVIVLYLEGVARAHDLFAAVDAARDQGVGIVALVGGRTDRGAAAAASHTAALSAPGPTFASLLSQRGVYVARDDVAAVDAAIALANNPRRAGGSCAVLTGSGGAGVVAADLLADGGVELSSLDPTTTTRIGSVLPGFAATSNPVDVTAKAIGDDEILRACTAAVVADPNVDSLLAVVRLEQAEFTVATSHATGVPAIVALLDGTAEETAGEVAAGRAVMPSLGQAANGMIAVVTAGAPTRADGRALPDVGPILDGDVSVTDAMDRVDRAGVAVARWTKVRDAAEARDFVRAVGGLVVLKADSGSQEHKASSGGLRLDVTELTLDEHLEHLLRSSPSVLVAEQVRGRGEYLVSASEDPAFGAIHTVGLGGGAVELIGRTVTMTATDDPDQQAAFVWAEVLGRRSGDEVLARRLVDVAWTLTGISRAHGGALVECNPVTVVGDQVVALDARMVAGGR